MRGSAHEPSPSCRRPAGDLDGRAAFLPAKRHRSVAHYTELKGAIDAPLLAKAIAEGMMQADTLRMRFAEDNGEVWQWIDEAMLLPEPSIVRVDSHDAAVALMEADLNQNLRVDSGQPLAFHQLIQGGRKPLVLVSAVSSSGGRWLQLPGHYASDRRHLRCVAERGTRARLPVYPVRRGGGGVPALSRQ